VQLFVPGRSPPRAGGRSSGGCASWAEKLTIALEDDATPADLGVVEQGLIDHARERGIEPRNHRLLTVLLRDERGRVAGGLVATTVWGWLQVTQLWIRDGLRGRGHGAALLATAEDEARRRGCHHVLLDTFDFQAREFYERRGYAIFGELAEFPRGHTRLFMQKAL
jgi:GNAT superfamily N-acetyltransferase